MADKTLNQIMMDFDLHKPTECTQCGSKDITYCGIGEYKCKDCGCLMYDDYGKVRAYVENHRGANELDVAQATGVSRDKIKQFVREQRFDVINGHYGE